MTTDQFHLTEDQLAIQGIVRTITSRRSSGDADRCNTFVLSALG